MDTPSLAPFRHVSETKRTDEARNCIPRKSRLVFHTSVRVLAPPHGDPTPAAALPQALKQLESVDEDLSQRVRAAFEHRPIWTKSALAYELKVNRSVLKIATVAFAYCASQGPYRMCYVSSTSSFLFCDELHRLGVANIAAGSRHHPHNRIKIPSRFATASILGKSLQPNGSKPWTAASKPAPGSSGPLRVTWFQLKSLPLTLDRV